MVDTNVISAGAPTKAALSPGLDCWMDRNSDRIFLSVVTIAEIEDGVAKCRREGAVRKAGLLAEWLETLLHLYSARILPLDIPTARALGTFADRARAAVHAPGFADLAIAATAWCRGHTVLTRNMRHFRMFGVPAHDPFESLPLCAGAPNA